MKTTRNQKWEQQRVSQMMQEMFEEGIEGCVTVFSNGGWAVTFNEGSSGYSLFNSHKNGFDLVNAAYLATINGRG